MDGNENTLSSAKQKFVDFLKTQSRASATIVAYSKDIAQLTDFLNNKQITQNGSVLPEHIEQFKEYLAENKYTAKSISRKLNSIKTFFKFLKGSSLVDTNPTNTVSYPRYELKPPRILTKMEYRALRDAARDDIRMAAIIELLLQTGMRISELARLTQTDVSAKGLRVGSFEGHPERIIPLNPSARKALDRYLNQRPKTANPNIFVTKTGKPLLVRNIRAAIDRYFKIADINHATVNDLRHTFIAHQLMAGASVVMVQQLVGHKRLSTTEKYLEMVKDQVKENVKLEEL